MIRTARPLAVVAAGLSLVVMALAGCGSGGGTAPGGTASGGGSTGTPTVQTYAQCMRDHEIDMADPDPSTGVPQFGEGVDPDDPAVKQALAACQDLLPVGSRGEPSDADLDVYVAFAQCMRDNGLPSFPDPQPGSAGGLFAGADVDRNDPAFQQAAQQCQTILDKAGA
ncbi:MULTISPECIES: hypothetical protein [unclassified Parafrankia]|uniref:Lipoprotein n=2 Tax=Parafrankia soli TaxID=2599596 RepID=A0A1S1RJN8_9ACTN|nr:MULTISPECIES: hypothetical protein [unclassified Parafrankia]OHV45625.1 hypothetical protein BBK14_30085 [Parafrankia soli]TCJ35354.1 hypothetical protein E0504_27915 [Parafrankia sp. BMG5.11]CAI7974446.1 conserved exported hypothetical protein [Frankia sp. Hr75.2]SQD99256.1 conserved exported hypothetical protein [Parafrankia sp. Ea1.12]